MSAPSLASFILKRPLLMRWMVPIANWHGRAAGYRQLGLRYEPFFVGHWNKQRSSSVP